MTTIGLVANDQLLAVVLNPKVTSGNQNTVALHVDFSEDWDGFGKSAVFFTSNDTSIVYEKVMTDGKCIVPTEVMNTDGLLYIGVRGVNSDNNEVKTTSLVKYKISEGAPAGTGTEIEPTSDVYQQLLAAYGETNDALIQEKSERQAEIAVERARINQFTSLPNGSTTGDAELQDIRVGANGTVYGSAGESVRGQVGELKSGLDNTNKKLADETARAINRENEIESLFNMPTEDAVNDWLNNHPEVTTTVQDNSLTLPKFESKLSEKIKPSNVYYLDDYGCDYTQGKSIAEVFPTVTLDEVQSLDSSATLSNSNVWYMLQKLIKELPINSVIILPNKNLWLDRTVVVDRNGLIIKGADELNKCTLNFTIADKITPFFRFTKNGESQLQNVLFKNINFYGTLNYNSKMYSGNGVEFDNSNSNGSKKSDCMNVSFENCNFSRFKNGIFVKSASYISSYFYRCNFSYNVENGFYGKHTGAIQVNEIDFYKCGGLCNGLDPDNNFEVDSGKDKAWLNISGFGVSLFASSGSIGCNNIILNDGASNGISINGGYTEANKDYDLKIMGNNVENFVINSPRFDRYKIYTVDTNILKKSHLNLLWDNLNNNIDLRHSYVVNSGSPYVKGMKSGYLLTKSDLGKNIILEKNVESFKKATISFDFEYIGTRGNEIYSYFLLENVVKGSLCPYLTNEDEVQQTQKINKITTNGNNFIVECVENIKSDITQLEFFRCDKYEKSYISAIHKYDRLDFLPIYGGLVVTDLTNVSIVDNKITIPQSLLGEYLPTFETNGWDWYVLPIKKISSLSRGSHMFDIKWLDGTSGTWSQTISLTDDNKNYYMNKVVKKIKVCFNDMGIPEDTKLFISNIDFKVE